MTKISELEIGAAKGTVTGELTSVGEPRDIITKFGKKTRVQDTTLADKSGECRLSLWGDDIGKYAKGNTVKVENGYVSVFKGQTQLSAGKLGKISKA